MSTPAARKIVAPVQQTIRVPAETARAFNVLTGRIADWWDRSVSANPTRTAIADIVIEPAVGGRWYERATDGTECDWAGVRVWEPGVRLVADWNPDGQHPTVLELLFETPAPRATNLTLLHSGFESYGDRAEQMRATHDAIWSQLLGRFARLIEEQQPGGDEPATSAEHAEPRAVTDGETILATIDLPAGAERIFRALTTAEVERWWGAADTYRVTNWNSDLSAGGQWSLIVVTPDGGKFPASGEYLTVDAPNKLVLTRRYDFDYPELGRRATTVTYALHPIAGGTRVTVRHDGFEGLRVAAEHHADGWLGFLSYLGAYIRAEVQSA